MKTGKLRIGLAAAALALALPVAFAQHPGKVNLGDYAVFDGITPTIEVKLDGRMLRFAGAAAKQGHPGMALAADLDEVNVYVYDVEPGQEDLFLDSMNALAADLAFDGWEAAVTVRERGSEFVRVFIKGTEEYLDGITVLVMDDEAVFVNIAGYIDPDTLAELIDNHGHIGDLDIDIDI